MFLVEKFATACDFIVNDIVVPYLFVAPVALIFAAVVSSTKEDDIKKSVDVSPTVENVTFPSTENVSTLSFE